MARTDTKQVLFSAAMELFGERGFTGTTVDEIVERAGVAKGTVYYHFKSKADLVEALIVQHLEPLAARFLEVVAESPSPPEQLAALVRAQLEFIRDDYSFAKLLIGEMWREDRMWSEALDLLWDNAISVMVGVVEAGMASGDFGSENDARLSASAIFGMSAVVGLSWQMTRPDRSIEEIEAHVERLAVQSLR